MVPGIRDTQCGFKLFRANPAKSIFRNVRCRGWAFDVEVLLIARKMGFAIAEVAVRWANDSGSKVRVLRHAPETIASLVAMRVRWCGRRPTER